MITIKQEERSLKISLGIFSFLVLSFIAYNLGTEIIPPPERREVVQKDLINAIFFSFSWMFAIYSLYQLKHPGIKGIKIIGYALLVQIAIGVLFSLMDLTIGDPSLVLFHFFLSFAFGIPALIGIFFVFLMAVAGG